MNEFFALIIPVIASTIAIIFWHTRVTWWEMLLPVVIGFFIILGLKYAEQSYNVSDTEYRSHYVVKACYEEPWNEYIHKTCSYTTCTGTKVKTCVTHTYDCSYVKYHPAEWYLVDDDGNSFTISQAKYNHLIKVWGNQSFVDMDRNYYTQNGNKYQTYWNNQINTIITTTTDHSYENRIQCSTSIYNFDDLSDQQKLQYKVYDYPEIDDYNMNFILHPKDYKINQYQQNHFGAINGLLGKKKQVTVFLCIFKNQTIQSGLMQKQYWKGGNKNELVICVGVDNFNNIKWNYVFSWTEKPLIHIKIRDYLSKQKTLNTWKLRNYTLTTTNKYWTRSSFSKYKFLQIELSSTQIVWIYIITTIVTIGLILYAVLNDHNPEYIESNNDWISDLKLWLKRIKDKFYW